MSAHKLGEKNMHKPSNLDGLANGKVTAEKIITKKILSNVQMTRVIESLGSMVAVKTVSNPKEEPD